MKGTLRILLPLAILALGVGGAVLMFVLRPGAAKTSAGPEPPLVDVVIVNPEAYPATIRATGVVAPAREVNLIPEVSGRIVSQSGNLRPGGRFSKGELIARIDPRDYLLAIRQEKSQVQQAELDLQIEESRKQVARREWELLGDERSPEEVPLALRGPQLVTAELRLEAARSGLERARLNLERTYLRAPFNAMVAEEKLDIGQVVAPGGSVARLIGTDRFWVKASVPMERLRLVAFPSEGVPESKVRIVQDVGNGGRLEAIGRVLSLGAELDAQTRTAVLIVVIDDPLEQTGGALPILPGAFVNLEIEGKTLVRTYRLPRVAIFEGTRAWVVDRTDSLSRRELEIAWRDDKSVYVMAGLEAGDRVVTTRLSLSVEGMSVRVEDADAPGHG